MKLATFQRALLWSLLLLAGCRSEVLEGLDESEANQIIVRLSETGIDGCKVRSGSGHGATYSVTVPGDQMAKAVRSLSAVGLPRAKHEGFRSVYKDRALVPGRFEEKAMFLSALQEELSRTLESVQGVLWSRVHVTLRPQPRSIALKESQKVQVQSASVLVGYLDRGKKGPPLAKEQVQKIVANAVEGLEPASVAVVFSAEQRANESRTKLKQSPSGLGMLRWTLIALAVSSLVVATLVGGRRFGFWSRTRGVSA